MLTTTVGQRIRQARKEIGRTQKDLANACRCHRRTIMLIEADRENMAAFLFMEIAKALGTSLDWLAFGKEAA